MLVQIPITPSVFFVGCCLHRGRYWLHPRHLQRFMGCRPVPDRKAGWRRSSEILELVIRAFDVNVYLTRLSTAPENWDIASARIWLGLWIAWSAFAWWWQGLRAMGTKPSTCQAVESSMALQVNALGVVAWTTPEIGSGKEACGGFPFVANRVQ